MLTIVGLGPGDGRMLTREAWEVLSRAERILVRTARHPAVADLPAGTPIESFDEVYDAAERFEDVYHRITDTLINHAAVDGSHIVYAVPGHPFVGEATVSELLQKAALAGIDIEVVAGLSFIEPCLAAVGQDGLDGVQLLDALQIATEPYPQLSPDRPALLGQVYSRMLAGELKLALLAVYPPTHEVILIHAAGTDLERVEHLPLHRLDHSEVIDHLTACYIPSLPAAGDLAALAEVVATLRGPNGCPWDQKQTPKSLRQGFLEEVYEVLDALDEENDVALREELGDVLLHVVMQTQMANEEELFTLPEVIGGIVTKLIRRHPHVYGEADVAGSDEVKANWEAIKAHEKKDYGDDESLLDGLPRALPALALSQKIQEKVAYAGFDWQNIEGVYDKLREELVELQVAETGAARQEEIGDLLFTMVNIAKWLKIDAEIALRDANARFSHRFRFVERLAAARGQRLDKLAESALLDLWLEAKAAAEG